MPKLPYRTIVYVDGFNFYYGEVRGTSWKWLDPAALFQKVLGPQNKLEKVKYFTARVQPSPRDPNVNVRQDTYLRALQAHCRLVELHFGHFLRQADPHVDVKIQPVAQPHSGHDDSQAGGLVRLPRSPWGRTGARREHGDRSPAAVSNARIRTLAEPHSAGS